VASRGEKPEGDSLRTAKPYKRCHTLEGKKMLQKENAKKAAPRGKGHLGGGWLKMESGPREGVVKGVKCRKKGARKKWGKDGQGKGGKKVLVAKK